jgi:hypothetical protein
MASTAAKLKKHPAPVPALAVGPTVITVSAATPSPHDAFVPAGGTVQFLNADNVGYMIQLQKGNTTVLQFLPALGNTSLAVDPNAVSGTETDYNLVARFTPIVAKYTRDNAIGGRIIIRP